MAETTGLVQGVKINPPLQAAFAFIGPSAANNEIFFVLRTDNDSDALGSFKSNIVDGLTTALFGCRTVVVVHAANSAEILGFRIDPV